MKVEPDQVIIPADGAKISHDGTGTLEVTITNEDGDSVTIEVPAGQTVTWYPPAGWESATFRAPGNAEEFRAIQQDATADA